MEFVVLFLFFVMNVFNMIIENFVSMVIENLFIILVSLYVISKFVIIGKFSI